MEEYPHEFVDNWYMMPSELQENSGCCIIRAGRNIAKPNYAVGPKRITQYSLHVVMEGSVRVNGDGQTRFWHKGDVFILFPNVTYTYEIVAGGQLQMMWLALEGPQMPYLMRELGISREFGGLSAVMTPKLRGLFKQILHCVEQETPHPLELQSLLYAWIWEMRQNRQQEEKVQLSHGVSKDWLSRVKQYLELHYAEDVRIEHVARLAGVHRSHLSASFARKFGRSPGNFLRKMRMDKGAELLQNSELSVTEIALTVGYPELYTFTRAFTAYFGVSPTKFRK